MTVAAMHAVADAIEAAKTGYDQDKRWWLLDPVKRTIRPGMSTDCSAGCLTIALLGGYPVDLTAPAYTGTIAAKLKAAGWSVYRFAHISQARPGDMIVTPGHHVVYVRALDRWWSAEADEHGRASGGQLGDQTGREVVYRAPYDITMGGTRAAYLCRPPAEATPKPPSGVSVTKPQLAEDGILGPLTKAAIVKLLRAQSWSTIAVPLQRWAGVKVDGIIGPITMAAVQRKIGALVTRTWDVQTTRHLQVYINRGGK